MSTGISTGPNLVQSEVDVQVTGVVSLAPVADLRRAAQLGLGNGAVVEFLGGTPEQVPDAYAIAEPAALIDTVAELSQ